MRYLITGGAGFIGSHLSERLLADGHEVVVVDDLSTGRLANLDGCDDRRGFAFRQGDVAAADWLSEEVAESDVVVHLASAVGVRRVLQDPLDTLRRNVLGTQAVFEAATRARVRLVFASTSEVYGKATHLPLSEDDDITLGRTSVPRWSYAATKLVGEHAALALHRQRDLPVVIVRLFNTVGPRQLSDYGMVVPNFVGAALDGRAIVVHGDGSQTRCFCHVGDAVEALARLTTLDDALGQVVNIGNDEEVTILDLAERVRRSIDSPSAIEMIDRREALGPEFEEPARRVPCLKKLTGLLGFRPRRSLDDILADCAEWLREEQRAGEQSTA